MTRLALAAALALLSGPVLAQGVAPGGGIGGSTGIGSGLGGVTGTGPSWPNGTNQAPQPTVPSVPPGGYASPAPPSSYTPSSPSAARPSTNGSGSTYHQPNEPYATSTPRPPASIPLTLPAQPNDLAFVKGCWRSDNFAYAGHRGTVTWCFDEKGGGRYLFTRTDQPKVFFCNAQAQTGWQGNDLRLTATKPACDDGSANAPAEFTCSSGTDGALCSGAGDAKVRLYRVR